MKIGVGISIVTNLIKGEGGVGPPPVTPVRFYFNDDALTMNYFADDAFTERYTSS